MSEKKTPKIYMSFRNNQKAIEVPNGLRARYDHLTVKAESGQKHLHLFGGGILRFVQNDKRVIQGASTHVCAPRQALRARTLSKRQHKKKGADCYVQ